ncbi:MAG TPA: D-alanyl-D-alanine carboxypeptidase [Actinomycetes bacterium]|nr:D-alanyl-D-alanine carboxypeptidase [Actinomycetes bacterium]
MHSRLRASSHPLGGRLITVALLSALLAVACALPAAAGTGSRAPGGAGGVRTARLAAPAAPAVGARAGLLLDAASGAVLWSRQGHRPVLPASTTKILTALVAESAYQPSQRFKVPEAAVRVDGSRFGFLPGMTLTRDQLLVTLLTVSANDAAETLAAGWRQGGRAGFLRRMQQLADQLGCTDSTWRDPAGLDAPGHRASAADLALLGRALLRRPVLAQIVGAGRSRFRWPGGRVQILDNHNKLLRSGEPGVLGIKTGYTTRAGHTLVAAERRRGRTLVAVVLGSKDIYGDVRALFTYGFAAGAPPRGAEVLGPEPAAQPSGRSVHTGAARQDPAASGFPTRTAIGWLVVPLPLVAAGVALLGLLLVAVSARRRRQHRSDAWR